MPFPNQHSGRVRNPGDFEEGSFRMTALSPGVTLISGHLKGETTMTAQTYRFDASKFTTAQAKAWLKEHDVEVVSFEAAIGKEAQKAICPGCGEMTVAKDGAPSDYECGKCGTGMVPFKLDIATVDEMEIFRTGTWRGHDYTIEDLDSMVANQKAGYIRGYMYVSPDGDHDPRNAGSRPMLSALAHGWIEKLWRVNDRLKATLKQVPIQLAQMIDKGSLKQKSVEVWPKFKTQDGKWHGAAFEAVMMFGRGLPAVYDLDDAVKVYYTVDRSEKDDRHTIELEKYTVSDRPAPRDGTNDDEKNTIREAAARKLAAEKRIKEKAMSEELEKLRQVETAKMQAEIALQKAQAEHEAEIAKLKRESTEQIDRLKAEAKAEAEKLTAVKREARKGDVVKFVDKQIKEFRVAPSAKDAEVDLILGMKEDEAKARMDLLSKLTAVHGDVEIETTEPDFDKLPQNLKDDVKKADRIEKVAEELMKKNPAMSASEALERAKVSVT